MLGMLGQTTEYAALPEQWSDWKITDRIGAGSFGTVYRVQKIDEPVCVGAIKVIQIPIDDTETEILLREYHNEESILNYYRELAEEYKREIDILNSLKFCPNIVFCQDCCIEPRENAPGWNLYVLMEHLISFDVHCLHTELNEAKVIQIGLDICSALSTCHAKGILHRDIKPDNILVSRSGEYKLADFGMAKNISKTYGTMSIKGTFSYMAPEIYTGQKYNSRADIYSLGLVLYRLMNHNREPFVNTQKQVIYYKDKEEALSRRMGGEELPAPLDASLEFSEIILKACAFNPQERYSNADALLADLQKLSRGEYRCKKRKQKTHNRTIKRKQMITLLSVILIAAFCITVIFSYRSHHEIASGTCGENISYSLRENNCLYIHGTGALNSIGSFDSISARITTVIIEPGITSIGDYALKDLTFLQRVSIPDTVTEIGSCAFQNCSSLVKANIPDSVTIIGSWAFQGCSSLKHITLSENITVIPTACFSDCSSLIKVNIPNDVIFIGTYAFWKCTSLNDILIPENVKIIHDSAFFNCSSLKEITLPNSIQNIGANAFHGCTSLTEVTLPANLSRIKDSTFSFCFSLYRVTIPDSVTMIEEYAFQNCTSLIEIFIPNSVDTIENFAFADCTSLSKASLPVHAVPDRAIFPFSNCTSLSEIVLLKTDSSIEIEPKLFLGFTSLQSITIPEGIIKIGDYAFSGCSSLQNLTISDNVTKIGEGAFYNCSSLQNLEIPDGITKIGDVAFEGCSSLQNLTIPEGITKIGYGAFSDCSSLQNLTIPDSVTKIGDYAFDGCSSLQNLTISDNVTKIGDGAFCNCSSLQNLTIPEGVTKIGYGAFSDCSFLQNLTIPDSVTKIGDVAFEGCSSLQNLTIPEGVTKIGYSAFSDCSSLQNLTIPDSVTKIGDYTFDGCSSLQNLTIPDSVTKIGVSAFANCSSLKEVTIPDSVTKIRPNAFAKCSNLKKIHISKTLLAELDKQKTTDWYNKIIPLTESIFAATPWLESYLNPKTIS